MGANMAQRPRRAGVELVGFNRDASTTQTLAAECGLITAASPEELIAKLDAPRVVWLMRPAGEITESYVGHTLCIVGCLSRSCSGRYSSLRLH